MAEVRVPTLTSDGFLRDEFVPVTLETTAGAQAKADAAQAAAISAGGVNVNVKAFGAVGDGTADDTTAIADAETLAAALGGQVYYPRGTYLTGPQTLHSKVMWVGESREGSVIRLKPGSNADLLKTDGFDALTGTSGTSGNIGCRGHGLRSLTLDANRTQQTSMSRCYASFGWNNTVFDVDFINGHTIGVSSEWVGSDTTGDKMEALWSNFKVWNYGSVKGGAVGLDWSGPHDSIASNYVVATLDSTIRPFTATYGATPVNGSTAVIPGSGTYTFVTTEAALVSLFPETGGWFVVPHDTGNSNFSVISYATASTAGAVTTFTGCTGGAGRTVGTSVTGVGIIKPTWGLMVNRAQKGEFAFVHTQAHIWGRNHIGMGCKMLTSPYYDVPIFSTGCHVEGAFLANVLMSSKSVFTGGAIYGTNGQAGNDYEVGLLMSLPARGAETTKIDTLIYNIGKSGGPATSAPVVNVNSASFDLNIIGQTNTAQMLLQADVYRQTSRARLLCTNDSSKSVDYHPSIAPIPIFGGGLTIGGTAGPRLTGGTGAPATGGAGKVGDVYFRLDGAATGRYVYRATTVASGLITAWTPDIAGINVDTTGAVDGMSVVYDATTGGFKLVLIGNGPPLTETMLASPLGNGSVFTSDTYDSDAVAPGKLFDTIRVQITADALFTAKAQSSSDGTTWSDQTTLTVTSNAVDQIVTPAARYARIVITGAATGMTSMLAKVVLQ